MTGNVWVVADHWKGSVSEGTYEVLALGRGLADLLGVRLEVVLAGHGVQGLTESLGLADAVLYVDHPVLADATGEQTSRSLAAVASDRTPAFILVPITNVSWNLLGLLPGRLDAPLVNFCRDIEVVDGAVQASCLLYGGKMAVTVMAGPGPVVLAVLPGARSPDAGHSTATPTVEEVSVDLADDSRVRLVEFEEPEAGDVDITQQDVLVAVGRGISNEANLEVAEELADVLDGAVCGSRPVIDQGWLPLMRQVGKSGASVKPRLYFAAGISGAPEHVEGMRDAEMIVAVNTDADAPIFSVADYGIVDDAADVLEALAEAVKEWEGLAPMPDPTTTTYLGIPGWVYLWALTAAAFLIFSRRAYLILTAVGRGQAEARWGQLPRRLWSVVVNVAGQRRMFDSLGMGLAHLIIFWTFIFYAVSFAWNLIRGLFPFLPIPYADEVWWVTLPMELLSVATLVALVGVAIRRFAMPPPRLTLSRDAGFILLLIALLMVTFLVGQGAKAAAEPEPVTGSPVGNLIGSALGGLSESAADSLFLAMWWIHMVAVLGFVAYLPYSKHLHLLASPFNVFTASLDTGGMPPPSEGAARLEDFTWRELFNGLSCAECGRCDRACPAFAEGQVLSPQDLIHSVRLMVLDAAGGNGRGNGNGTGNGSSNGTGNLIDTVSAEAIWSCTTCMACMDRCPVFNEHVPLIVQMRRHLIGEGEVGTGVQDMLMGMSRYGNSFGQSPRKRPKWTKDLEFELSDARKQPVKHLWYVGDYASFDPRVQEVSRSAARVFGRAGLDFGILYESEQNAGNDVRRLGEEGLFEMLKDKNMEALESSQFETIMTTDPHTYFVLKHEYQLDGKVRHYTEVLDELISSGRLSVTTNPGARVTYHDPCYLGRYGGVYDAPRRVIEQLGLELVEMPRNRSSAYCCGAGGGRIWMEDTASGGERPAESRVREAAGLEGVTTLVVACPKDLVMFRDALKTTELEGSLVIRDIAELVEEAMVVDEARATQDAVGATQRSGL